MRRTDFAMALHGGAGAIPRASMSDAQEAQYRAVLAEALTAGHRVLAAGDTALEAVCQALRVMEDSPLFNAGRGSVFTHKGEIEMDAAVMVGRTRAAGAVCQLKAVKNPVFAARAVMERSGHVLLAAAGAQAFAESAVLVFQSAGIVVAVAFVLSLFIKEVALRTKSGVQEKAEAAAAALG